MFFRQRQMAYHCQAEKPDPNFAKMLQEPLGGQWGEISVMMTYLFQGWSCRGPQKYRTCSSTSARRRSATWRCWPR
jgi:Mn-containing catalase